MNELNRSYPNSDSFQRQNLLPISINKKHLPGELLQKYRQRAKLSQAELAELLDLRSRRMIQSWESNDNVPRPDRLQKIIELYVKHKVFMENLQYQEAGVLWDTVKNYSDAKSRKLSAYPIFDLEWFENISRTLTILKSADLHTQVKNSTGLGKSNKIITSSVLSLQPLMEADEYEVDDTLIGRQQEVSDILKLLKPNLAQPRLLTLTGMGGIGKTSLALEVKNQLLKSTAFEDGVIWVSLVTARYPQQLIDAMILAFNLSDNKSGNEQDNLFKVICAYLQDKHMLLVLDNFEQILEARSIVLDLLKSTTKLKIMITSRCILDLPAEQQYVVLPLASPKIAFAMNHSCSVEDLAHIALAPAIQLFVKRVKLVNFEFELNTDNAIQITEICTRLEGLPLAIEIAASRIKLFSLSSMIQRLKHRLDFLGGKQLSSQLHQRTLYSTLSWSYNLLDNSEQQLCRTFGLLIAGGSMHMLEWLCSRSNVDKGGMELVAGLIDKSLLIKHNLQEVKSLERISTNGSNPTNSYDSENIVVVLAEPRFKMLEIVREFALTQLNSTNGALEENILLMLNYYLELFLQAETGLRDSHQLQWLEWFNLEYPNIQILFDTILVTEFNSFQSKIYALCLKLVPLLRHFWIRKGYFVEGSNYLSQILNNSKKQLKQTEQNTSHFYDNLTNEQLASDYARALEALAILMTKQCNFAKSLEYLSECEILYRKQANKSRLSNLLNTKGVINKRIGNIVEAKKLYEASLSGFVELDDAVGAEHVLTNLGTIERLLGNYDKGIEYYQTVLLTYKKRNDLDSLITVLNSLALLLIEQGDYALAVQYLEEALSINIEDQKNTNYSNIINNLGLVEYHRQNYDKAFIYYEQSFKIDQELGIQDGMANSLVNLAQLYIVHNNLEEAQQHLEEGLSIAKELGSKHILAEGLYYLSIVLIKQSYSCLHLEVAQNKKNEIKLILRQVLQLQIEVGNKKDIAFSLSLIARFVMLEGNWKEAALLFGFVTKSLAQIQRKNDNQDWKNEYGNDIVLLEQKSLPAEFNIAWQEGSIALLPVIQSYILNECINIS